ncbi:MULTISPECIES: hypothetical protein [unclassified Sphingomonas]|uniref:hypothetical protein n=1 Tax=unclassified Sphingomonas TaxID=196159 RepID=UPI002865B6CB|nr:MULTISPECIES: hypothetical protein [unclassified Sphingomonas]MDR6116568.1 hypothetical protein [Sphingomonas sp. SORGH_AS_0789]MDR6149755.1 hypothetical protein [Sphingomonas sp. SORGH_AS_0742]
MDDAERLAGKRAFMPVEQRAGDMSGIDRDRRPVGGDERLAPVLVDTGAGAGIAREIAQQDRKRQAASDRHRQQQARRGKAQHGIANLGPT